MIFRLAVLGEQVVGDRVALASAAVSVDRYRALSVEMSRRLVAIEIREHRRQGLSSFEHVGRPAALPLHVNGEAGVGGEERLLTLGVASIGAVGVGVEQLANCESVGGLQRREFGAKTMDDTPRSRIRSTH